jgi:Contractile injection system tube protein
MADEKTLTKAILKTVDATSNWEVELKFNPTQYVKNKAVQWQLHKDTVADAPGVEFTAGAPQTLSMDCMFDGFEQQEDVEDLYVSKIRKMALIDEDLERPPMVVLVWGSNDVFKGVVTKVDTTLTMFTRDGIATRAKVTFAMQETTEAVSKAQADERKKNKAPAGTTAAAGSNRTDQANPSNPRAAADSADGEVNDRGEVTPGRPVARGRA